MKHGSVIGATFTLKRPCKVGIYCPPLNINIQSDVIGPLPCNNSTPAHTIEDLGSLPTHDLSNSHTQKTTLLQPCMTVTRLLQPCYKVVQGCNYNPFYNLVTRL